MVAKVQTHHPRSSVILWRTYPAIPLAALLNSFMMLSLGSAGNFQRGTGDMLHTECKLCVWEAHGSQSVCGVYTKECQSCSPGDMILMG